MVGETAGIKSVEGCQHIIQSALIRAAAIGRAEGIQSTGSTYGESTRRAPTARLNAGFSSSYCRHEGHCRPTGGQRVVDEAQHSTAACYCQM